MFCFSRCWSLLLRSFFERWLLMNLLVFLPTCSHFCRNCLRPSGGLIWDCVRAMCVGHDVSELIEATKTQDWFSCLRGHASTRFSHHHYCQSLNHASSVVIVSSSSSSYLSSSSSFYHHHHHLNHHHHHFLHFHLHLISPLVAIQRLYCCSFRNSDRSKAVSRMVFMGLSLIKDFRNFPSK